MKYKKITKSGAITIPKEVRAEYGIFSGQAVNIEITEAGILISKHSKTCHICGSIENVVTHMDFEICKSCCESALEKAEV